MTHHHKKITLPESFAQMRLVFGTCARAHPLSSSCLNNPSCKRGLIKLAFEFISLFFPV